MTHLPYMEYQYTKTEINAMNMERKSRGDTTLMSKLAIFDVWVTLVTLNMGQSEKFKIMTHLLHMKHQQNKFEMDPMSMKQKS